VQRLHSTFRSAVRQKCFRISDGAPSVTGFERQKGGVRGVSIFGNILTPSPPSLTRRPNARRLLRIEKLAPPRRAYVAFVVALVCSLAGMRRAHAQACCAGAAAVTPARLAVHEDALVGVQARASDGFGTFFPDGSYVSASFPEWDLEQDLFSAM